MTNRKLRAYLKEHPYLLDANFVMTTSEAQAIIDAAEHVLSFEEMIAGAKKRFPQYSAAQWAEFDRSIAKRKKRMFRKQAREDHHQQYRKHYRVAIASFIAAVIVFFALIPAGRTLALEIYQYIIQVWKNYAEISQQQPPDAESKPDFDANDLTAHNKGIVSYASIEEFERETGLKPFVLDADWLTIESIEAQGDKNFGQTIWINYLDADGAWLRTTQEWLLGQDVYAWTDDDTFLKINVGNGQELYYGVDPDSLSFDGIMLLDTSLLLIGADSRIEVGMVVDIIKEQVYDVAAASN